MARSRKKQHLVQFERLWMQLNNRRKAEVKREIERVDEPRFVWRVKMATARPRVYPDDF